MTLAHGVFAPHPLASTELASLPDWAALDVVINGERFASTRGDVLTYRRELDLRTGLLRRDVTWRSPRGTRSRLVFERFVSLADPWIAAVRVTVTAIDHAGPVEVRASLGAYAKTGGRAHLVWDGQRVDDTSASLALHVEGGDTEVGLAMRVQVPGSVAEHEAWDVREHPVLVSRWAAQPGTSATFEKVVVLATSREVDAPAEAAEAHISGLGALDFDALHAASADAWQQTWAVSDVRIEGDPEAQLATRFSIYHLLIAGPRCDEQVSIGAKTLSGLGYLGHTFWDTETFMLPFFTHTQPAIARNLLSYRYHRLPGARRKAAANGYDGAQFPWESAATGDEVTPTWLPDPDDPTRLRRIWTGDIEIHISAVIARAAMEYWQSTRDDAFMRERGAELVIDSARFWASRAEWDAAIEHYRFRDVIGPDEYHDHVDDDAFTNYLAAWHLRSAADIIEWLTECDPDRAASILGSAAASAKLVERFRSVAAGIYLPYDPSTGLVEQFRGYFGRRDVNLRAYADHRRSMQAILGVEGVAETQVIKQPDVLMLAYLLPDMFDASTLAANYRYYSARTDHAFGSSLGPSIQALIAARMGDPDLAYEHFMLAARADLGDIRGNTSDGVHGASAGGLWQALAFGFAGLRFDGDAVTTAPNLPVHWRRLAFSIVHRGRIVDVDLRPEADPIAAGSPAMNDGLPFTVRGLIVDLDGVLANTAEAHYQAWRRLADEVGLPFDRRANEALRGVDRRTSLHRLLGGRAVPEAEAADLMARKNAYYLASIATMSPADILPGALELLDAARARGLRLALGSGSRNARAVLDRLGIADRFDAICDGNSAAVGKPAPDLFLAAAAQLGLAPETCVVLEDAADGVSAAHAAGMLAVGIGPEDRVGEADLVLPGGLAEVTLAGILASLADNGAIAA
jgi:kojibiose phosphorylase